MHTHKHAHTHANREIVNTRAHNLLFTSVADAGVLEVTTSRFTGDDLAPTIPTPGGGGGAAGVVAIDLRGT